MPTPITFGAVSARGFGFGSASAPERYWGGTDLVSSKWAWRGCATDQKGNLIFIGQAYTSASGITASIAADGSINWSRQFQKSGYGMSLYAVCVDASGNSYVVGVDNSAAGYFVAKYNASGTLQWQKNYSGGSLGAQPPKSVVSDSSGNVYVAAANSVLKIDSTGAPQWFVTWTTSTSTTTPPVSVVTSDGTDIYVAVAAVYFSGCCCCTANSNGQVLKISSAGSLTWGKSATGASDDNNVLALGLSGSFLVCRSSNTQKFYLFATSTGTATRYDLSSAISVAQGGVLQIMGTDRAGSIYTAGNTLTPALGNAYGLSKITLAAGVPTLASTLGVTYTGYTAAFAVYGIVTTPTKAVTAGYKGSYGSTEAPFALALHLDGSGTGTSGSYTVSSLGSLPTFSSQTSPFSGTISGFASGTVPTAASSSLTESAYSHSTYTTTVLP